MEFELGSRVSFESKYGRQTGTLIKFNRKTVTVITDNQNRWNVSTHLLCKELKDLNEKPALVLHSKNTRNNVVFLTIYTEHQPVKRLRIF